jgi:hypothetical protein
LELVCLETKEKMELLCLERMEMIELLCLERREMLELELSELTRKWLEKLHQKTMEPFLSFGWETKALLELLCLKKTEY